MQENKRGIFGFIVVTVSIALIAIFVLTQLERVKPGKDRVPVEDRTPAHELAIFTEGNYVPEENDRVQQFEELLEELTSNTSSSKSEIASLSTDAVIQLRNEMDAEVTLKEFLERAIDLSSKTAPGIKFEEISSKVTIIFSEEGSEA